MVARLKVGGSSWPRAAILFSESVRARDSFTTRRSWPSESRTAKPTHRAARRKLRNEPDAPRRETRETNWVRGAGKPRNQPTAPPGENCETNPPRGGAAGATVSLRMDLTCDYGNGYGMLEETSGFIASRSFGRASARIERGATRSGHPGRGLDSDQYGTRRPTTAYRAGALTARARPAMLRAVTVLRGSRDRFGGVRAVPAWV